LINADIEETRK
jgi:hypothetical protein